MEPGEKFVCRLEAQSGETPEFCLGEICCGIYKRQSNLPTILLWISLLLLIVSAVLYYTFAHGSITGNEENEENQSTEQESSSTEDEPSSNLESQSKKQRVQKIEKSSKKDKYFDRRKEDENISDEPIGNHANQAKSYETTNSYRKYEPSKTSKTLNNTKTKYGEKKKTDRVRSNKIYAKFENNTSERKISIDNRNHSNNNKVDPNDDKRDIYRDYSETSNESVDTFRKEFKSYKREKSHKKYEPSEDQKNTSINKNKENGVFKPERKIYEEKRTPEQDFDGLSKGNDLFELIEPPENKGKYLEATDSYEKDNSAVVIKPAANTKSDYDKRNNKEIKHDTKKEDTNENQIHYSKTGSKVYKNSSIYIEIHQNFGTRNKDNDHFKSDESLDLLRKEVRSLKREMSYDWNKQLENTESTSKNKKKKAYNEKVPERTNNHVGNKSDRNVQGIKDQNKSNASVASIRKEIRVSKLKISFDNKESLYNEENPSNLAEKEGEENKSERTNYDQKNNTDPDFDEWNDGKEFSEFTEPSENRNESPETMNSYEKDERSENLKRATNMKKDESDENEKEIEHSNTSYRLEDLQSNKKCSNDYKTSSIYSEINQNLDTRYEVNDHFDKSKESVDIFRREIRSPEISITYKKDEPSENTESPLNKKNEGFEDSDLERKKHSVISETDQDFNEINKGETTFEEHNEPSAKNEKSLKATNFYQEDKPSGSFKSETNAESYKGEGNIKAMDYNNEKGNESDDKAEFNKPGSNGNTNSRSSIFFLIDQNLGKRNKDNNHPGKSEEPAGIFIKGARSSIGNISYKRDGPSEKTENPSNHKDDQYEENEPEILFGNVISKPNQHSDEGNKYEDNFKETIEPSINKEHSLETKSVYEEHEALGNLKTTTNTKMNSNEKNETKTENHDKRYETYEVKDKSGNPGLSDNANSSNIGEINQNLHNSIEEKGDTDESLDFYKKEVWSPGRKTTNEKADPLNNKDSLLNNEESQDGENELERTADNTTSKGDQDFNGSNKTQNRPTLKELMKPSDKYGDKTSSEKSGSEDKTRSIKTSKIDKNVDNINEGIDDFGESLYQVIKENGAPEHSISHTRYTDEHSDSSAKSPIENGIEDAKTESQGKYNNEQETENDDKAKSKDEDIKFYDRSNNADDDDVKFLNDDSQNESKNVHLEEHYPIGKSSSNISDITSGILPLKRDQEDMNEQVDVKSHEENEFKTKKNEGNT